MCVRVSGQQLSKQVCRSHRVGPPYCLAELYTGRVACCYRVSHGVYADGTDRQTDGRQNVTLRILLVCLTDKREGNQNCSVLCCVQYTTVLINVLSVKRGVRNK